MQMQSIQLSQESIGSALEIVAAAHDLRNRIGVAGCEVHLLRKRIAGGTAFASEFLSSLERTLRAANDQLESLLELLCAQATLQVGSDSAELLDLVGMVKRVVAQHDSASDVHEFTLLNTSPEIAGVWDEGRLTYALTSLLTNAINYSPAGGDILVTLHVQDDEAVLRVIDGGIGIPAIELSHVFEPFYRGRNAEPLCAGLGLGLATARLIVEQYGGVLDVKSIEGEGATFTIRMPLPMSRFGSGCASPADRECAPRGHAPSLD